jgi:hypothetical protein
VKACSLPPTSPSMPVGGSAVVRRPQRAQAQTPRFTRVTRTGLATSSWWS